MSGMIRTGVALPGAMPLGAITELERLVSPYRPSMWFEARDVPPEVRGIVVRERISGVDFMSMGAAYHGSIGSPARPAIRFSNNSLAYMTAPYTIPPSYGIFALGQINAYVASTGSTIIASRSAADDRMFLGVSPAGRFNLIHTSDQITGARATGTSGAYCGWASFDSSEKSCALSLNSITAETSGSFTNLHKGQSESAIGGWESSGVGVSNQNGWIETVIVFPYAIHSPAFDRMRTDVMTYLSTRGGVALV